jgi:hypothetical protein
MKEEHQNERLFDSIAAVLKYLKEAGWRVAKTTIYRHRNEGKFLPAAGGEFRQRDIDKYARAWLKRLDTGQKVSDRIDDLQRRKLERELKTLDLEFERKKFAHDRDLGLYVSKERVEVEWAGRVGILEAGLKQWIRSCVGSWIRLAGGDLNKTGELVNEMMRDLDEQLNSYAVAKEYDLEVEPAEADHDGKGS